MSTKTIPNPWRVADVNFIKIDITHRTDKQLRIEFDCGLPVVITHERQIPFAARLIETLRAGKGGLGLRRFSTKPARMPTRVWAALHLDSYPARTKV